jgi:hypothetical protein
LLATAFYFGSWHGITGIAWGWIVAYPLVALPLCRKTLQVLNLSAREYVGVLWPALEATIAMVVTVMLVRLTLPPSLHAAGRLILEVVIGAMIYIGTIAVRHNDRLRAVVQMARRLLSKRSEVRAFETTS